MLKLFSHIKEKWYIVVCIVALLFLQAQCELALPDYTSRIVNIGIQQNGIEDGVPSEIRNQPMEELFLFMQEEDIKIVKQAYTLEDDKYILSQTITKEERANLNQIFAEPMMFMLGIVGGGEAGSDMQMQIPPGMSLTEIPKEHLQQGIAAAREKIEEFPEMMIAQAAIRYVQEEYIQQGKDIDKMQLDYVKVSGLHMLGMSVVSMTTAIIVTLLSSRLAATLGKNLRNKIYKKVLAFSGAEMNRFSTASLITRSTNDIQQIQTLMALIFRIVLYAPILGIGGVLKVLDTESTMSWILLLAIGLISLLVAFLFTFAMPKFKALQNLLDKLNLVTREILTGLSVIRVFNNQAREEERFEEANQNLTRTTLFVNRCMSVMFPLMFLIMNGTTILIIYNGAIAVDEGSMQVGNMMAFIQYTMQIIMSFLMLTMMSIMIPRASVSAKRVQEVLDVEVTIHDADTPKLTGEIKGLVEFENVSFSYPDAEEKIINHISFTAEKGETVAFIGSTGSGKSTLVNLIPRLFDVTEGSIKVDGVDVREYTLKELREKIGYIPQKGVLFSGTIDSNIRFGNEAAVEEQVKKAAQIAQAWDFIEEKEEGIHTPISQGGSNVSGGQKQRLSIARAVVKNPEIYIFDDSFSALDYKTDVALRRALKNATAEATTLIVAQRISTILHADKIIVIDEGEIVGEGTHKELLKSCEVYKQIASSQLSEEELAHE